MNTEVKTSVKTPVAKTATVKTPVAKTATVKAKIATKVVAKKAVAKKVVAKKVKAARPAKVASVLISPVVATIAGLINAKTTSLEDLKTLRLELRKAVKATRAIVNARAAVKVVAVKTVTVKKVVAVKAVATEAVIA